MYVQLLFKKKNFLISQRCDIQNLDLIEVLNLSKYILQNPIYSL